jgi:predicted ATPase
MERFVIISGCSGGGKSTLLTELKRRGHAIVEEPGRRIIAEELKGAGTALPWVDLAAFARRAIAMSQDDRSTAAKTQGLVFFDRGLIDAAVALEHATRMPVIKNYASERYNQRVFVTPPWPEIYVNDADRRHDFDEAVAEYERLIVAFSSLNYEVDVLPKVAVADRADIVLERLDSALSP